MNSFNHYAYGAIGDWMYRVMVGLDADEIGYKKIRIKPHIGGGFTNASASYLTAYGEVKAGWKIENGKLILDGKIPANTTATFYIPGPADSITEAGKPLSSIRDIEVGPFENGYTSVKCGSGGFSFVMAWRQ
jgi:alpha-L-rhamnosidase